MITLYGINKIFAGGAGETKDLWIQWVLEETGLPYRFQGLDQTAGDLSSPTFSAISPFQQIPVIDDDGFVLSESVAIALYLSDKSGKLIPNDAKGRARVTQWCLAAMSTVYGTLTVLDLIAIFDKDRAARQLDAETHKLAARWLGGIERHLHDREWLADLEFSVADVVMAGVLRTTRSSDLLLPFPEVRKYFERCQARPAWQRTLELSAQRLKMAVDSIR